MQTDNRLLDDLARLASGALGAAAAAREECEAAMKAAFRRWASELDLVTRDEFEAMRATAEAAMEKAAELETRLAALEAAAKAATPAAAKNTTKKRAAGKSKEKASPPSGGS